MAKNSKWVCRFVPVLSIRQRQGGWEAGPLWQEMIPLCSAHQPLCSCLWPVRVRLCSHYYRTMRAVNYDLQNGLSLSAARAFDSSPSPASPSFFVMAWPGLACFVFPVLGSTDSTLKYCSGQNVAWVLRDPGLDPRGAY